jgi:hypothetical protein
MVLMTAGAPEKFLNNMLSGKSCSWRKSWAKAHRVLYEMILKIKNT